MLPLHIDTVPRTITLVKLYKSGHSDSKIPYIKISKCNYNVILWLALALSTYCYGIHLFRGKHSYPNVYNNALLIGLQCMAWTVLFVCTEEQRGCSKGLTTEILTISRLSLGEGAGGGGRGGGGNFLYMA